MYHLFEKGSVPACKGCRDTCLNSKGTCPTVCRDTCLNSEGLGRLQAAGALPMRQGPPLQARTRTKCCQRARASEQSVSEDQL